MPRTDTAADQIQRMLFVLPAAARGEGASYGELAEALGTTPKQVMKDAQALVERDYYHRSGEALEAQLSLEAERVYLGTPGAFRRPIRLTAREALVLGLGLRARALEAGGERRERLLSLAAQVEDAFALPAARGAGEAVLAVEAERPGGEIFQVLAAAAREKRCCRIAYLKDGDAQPETRTVHPYVLVHAERWWYALGHCEQRGGVRAFRLDRVLSAERLAEGFEVPAGFDASGYLTGGRLFHAEETLEVRVRYSAAIARWIREHYPEAEPQADGALVVAHRVADPGWAVRHVLQYGADAELLQPAALREAVAARLEGRLGGAVGTGSAA